MPISISFKEYATYIQMEVKGEGHPDYILSESKRVWQRLSGLCNDLGKHQALLVLSLQNHIHIGMSMDLARLAEENGWARNYKLGIVTDLENHMTMDLMKSFLMHRGFETEVFDNLRVARRWLIPEFS